MDPQEVARFLQYPDRGLVDYAVSCANLTEHETAVIDRRYRRGETIEQAAEALLVSPRTVSNWQAAGVNKLDACWSGLRWVDTLIKQ